jgi:Ribbon-helix-helix protein, copG family
MRTIIDIPERQLKTLTQLGQERGLSRTEIIRQAIVIFLKLHESPPDRAFGLWKDRTEDGMRYQRILREEWGE